MSFLQTHLLSVILFTPLAGALLLLFVPGTREREIRWIASIVAALGFACAGLLRHARPADAGRR